MNHHQKISFSEFFCGKSVLLTGVTGFVGKVLLEKLLRSCPGLDRIYVIVRPKRGSGLKERLEELLALPFFDRCRSERGNIVWRCGTKEDGQKENGPVVVGVSGDVSQMEVGLSAVDKTALLSKVSIVFHVAATVRFNENLRLAVLLNTRGTREMLTLARSMPCLEAFVHVSTAYAHVNTHAGLMEERFYSVPIEPEDLIKAAEDLDDEKFQEIAEEQAKYYENTYLCTKALAERIIETDYQDLPVSIFRPGIVLSTHKEPMAGWTDGFQGPSVAIIGAATGLVNTLLCEEKNKPELVPVDHVVNAILAIARDRATHKKSEKVPIFNFVSSKVSPVDWNMMRNIITEVVTNKSGSSIYHKKAHFTKSRCLYTLNSLLRQYIARTLDFVESLRGKTTRIALTQQKIKAGIDSLIYFMNNEFDFSDVNLKALLYRTSKECEMKDFDFDVKHVEWDDYLKNYVSYLLTHSMAKEVPGIQSALKFTKGVSRFRLMFRSAQLLTVIFSVVSIYIMGYCAQKFYFEYLALQSEKT